ncbi:MAG: UDP-glucose 4-epimerase GalE [Proteobacteria bacterium]|nr:UDP-glucose 4-epimerase GalE [Cystobacterineae bacterium]MCL2314201.1 UDP-glucose 4-epimerase GalE [Pseudomonadota bacterium]
MPILVTGGAGYIGSHTCLKLMETGREVVVVDNFSNSHRSVLASLQTIVGRPPILVEGDIRDAALLGRLFASHPIEAVIHFAALKAVGESVQKPLEYYDNNLNGSLTLLKAMREAGVKVLVFSSSATVYGNPKQLPLREDTPLEATNPYGQSKLMLEAILQNLCEADSTWRVARLRYFNPIGAHESGLMGENPQGTPNNLVPYVAQVAAGKRPKLLVYGGDYPTPDGTGVRDYVHVMDLAEGHLSALEYIQREGGLLTLNLGGGRGYSVLEVVRMFEKVSMRKVAFEVVARRPGDIAECWADTSAALQTLGWKASRGLESMCMDTWRWQQGC